MPKTLEWFKNKELLIKDDTIKNIADNYLEKAKNNIITMDLLSKVVDFKEELELPEEYDADEWVVITAYYSMYLAALSVLAKLGYKSKNHTATNIALEEFLVKKELLDKEYLEILEKIKIQKEDIDKINGVRDKREIAQYSVTKETTKNISEEAKKDARKFVDKMEEVFDLLEEMPEEKETRK